MALSRLIFALIGSIEAVLRLYSSSVKTLCRLFEGYDEFVIVSVGRTNLKK
jgi:hypothetical protein